MNTIYTMRLPASFKTVTPFSKLLAFILFITLPFVFFYVGAVYGATLATITSFQEEETKVSQAQTTCSEEAKACPDGTYVFREQPSCNFTACPSLKISGKATPSGGMPKNGMTKENQIGMLLSQKTGIPQLDLIITYKNSAANKNLYDGGTYSSKEDSVSGRWIAARVNGNWIVTSISGGIPQCTEVNPYYYPKDLVPACKDAKNNIIAR